MSGAAGKLVTQTPYGSGEAVVVGTALAQTSRALYVGGAGNITATMADGTSLTFDGVPVGTILPIAITEVTAATATNMVALH